MNQTSNKQVTYPAATDTTKEYYGYYEKDKYYKYDTSVSSGTWVENTTCTDTDRVGSNVSGNMCISGNLLNFVTSSRIDIIRKIMTGGRLLSSTTDVFQHEGENQYAGYSGATLINPFAIDSLKCKFHLDRTSAYNATNDGTTPFTHDATLSIYNNVLMTLTTNGETIDVDANNGGKTTFHRDQNASPNVPTRSFTDDGWVAGKKFTTSGFSNAANNGKECTILSVDANDITCSGVISGMVDETNRAGVDFIESGVTLDSSNTCTVGTQMNAKIQIKGTAPGVTTGIIPSLYNLADIEFSFFSNGNSGSPEKVAYDGSYGTTAYSTVKSQSLSNYMNALNYSRMWGGTPTGYAMGEAQKFFQQTAMGSDTAATGAVAKATAADPYYDLVDGTLFPTPCRKSFIILVSDGEGSWTTGSTDPASYARAMHITDQRSDAALTGNQLVTTYVVFAFEGGTATAGANSMKAIAAYGGFNDKDSSTLPYDLPDPTTTDSKTVAWPRPNCNPGGTWNSNCAEWDKSPTPHTGLPYNYFEADNGDLLEEAFTKAVNDILSQVSSGTAASILGNNDNNGSTLLQALFYPERTFDNSTKMTWVGELQSFWYYIDPSLNSDALTIREDTASPNQLVLSDDRIARFFFNGTQTKVDLFSDSNGDGLADSSTPDTTVDPDEVKALWRAGLNLWSRASTDRTIFTNNPTSSTAAKLDFSTGNASTIAAYLDASTVSPYTLATNYINFMRGSSVGTLTRNRNITINNSSGTPVTNVWKLGDIINSTPKQLSEVRLNNYNLNPPTGYSDLTYEKYTKSKDYNARGVAFTGANDGMFHAFKLGTNFKGAATGTISEIKNSDGNAASDLGKELWAFVPKSALPYLQYLTDSNYKHVYYVDSTPFLVDVSINPTKFKMPDNSILTCDGTATAPFSSCALATTLSSGQLSYATTSDPSNIGDSVGTSWRTLLLGSMGVGGATSPSQVVSSGVTLTVNGSVKTFTRTAGSFLTDGWSAGKTFTATRFATAANNNRKFTIASVTATVITTTEAPTTEASATVDLMECVIKTPIMDPADTASPKTKGFGYSSYFALDVTSPQVTDLSGSATYPKLLWEFSDPSLGLSMSTPAIVRIKDPGDNGNPTRNGKWYAVIASGPTGPIDTYFNQMLGFSTQPLKIFVLDLASGALVRTFSTDPTAGINTNVSSLPVDAFANSITAGTIDVDRADKTLAGYYSDDAIYVGYTKRDTGTSTWTKGGVLRILTANDPNPANWKISTVIDGIGPVTSPIKKLQNNSTHKLWLYFGTGRYFYKTRVIDDADSQQALYGVLDRCFNTSNTFTDSCTTSITSSDLSDQTSRTAADTSALPSGKYGWYINLAASGTSYKAQRVISAPIASSTGTVFFVSFYPSADLCSYGGQSSAWAVNYDTGGAPPGNLRGQMLIQLSTGAFKQINLATGFTESGGRQTQTFPGVTPRDEASVVSNANHFPAKRILHIQER
jgi:type IV pilus assembly protein PilY1